MGLVGGMAERLKAHVLKTCLGHTNVGSNPTPSARRLVIARREPFPTKQSYAGVDCFAPLAMTEYIWGGARVVEWGRLLSGFRGEILGRRFESCPPRHIRNMLVVGHVLF